MIVEGYGYFPDGSFTTEQQLRDYFGGNIPRIYSDSGSIIYVGSGYTPPPFNAAEYYTANPPGPGGTGNYSGPTYGNDAFGGIGNFLGGSAGIAGADYGLTFNNGSIGVVTPYGSFSGNLAASGIDSLLQGNISVNTGTGYNPSTTLGGILEGIGNFFQDPSSLSTSFSDFFTNLPTNFSDFFTNFSNDPGSYLGQFGDFISGSGADIYNYLFGGSSGGTTAGGATSGGSTAGSYLQRLLGGGASGLGGVAGTAGLAYLLGKVLGDQTGMTSQSTTSGPNDLNRPIFGATSPQAVGLTGAPYQQYLQQLQQNQGQITDPAVAAFQSQLNAPDIADNPYFADYVTAMNQPVIDNYQRQIIPGIQGQAITQGGYGGSRQGVAEGIATSDLNRQLLNNNRTAAMDFYNRGMTAQGNAISQAPGVTNLKLNPFLAPISYIGAVNQLGAQYPGSTATQTTSASGPGAFLSGLGAASQIVGLGKDLYGA